MRLRLALLVPVEAIECLSELVQVLHRYFGLHLVYVIRPLGRPLCAFVPAPETLGASQMSTGQFTSENAVSVLI